MLFWKSNKTSRTTFDKAVSLCLVSRILKIKFLALNLCWRREWDSNPRTPKSLRFSRPVHSTSYAIPPYVAERERFELSLGKTPTNGLANRPLIATWVPLHIKQRTKGKKNKDRNLRSKRSTLEDSFVSI